MVRWQQADYDFHVSSALRLPLPARGFIVPDPYSEVSFSRASDRKVGIGATDVLLVLVLLASVVINILVWVRELSHAANLVSGAIAVICIVALSLRRIHRSSR